MSEPYVGEPEQGITVCFDTVVTIDLGKGLVAYVGVTKSGAMLQNIDSEEGGLRATEAAKKMICAIDPEKALAMRIGAGPRNSTLEDLWTETMVRAFGISDEAARPIVRRIVHDAIKGKIKNSREDTDD
jgi:hypothetical protein